MYAKALLLPGREPQKPMSQMNQKFTSMLENHPALGWLTSLAGWLVGWFTWFVDHVDLFSKFFAFGTSILAFAISWYVFRINRRKWQRMDKL
ncbi:MAG: hypothetical protein KGL39_45575 [Patescibacteria group bacterium]|nr:hypothetical protein [Patescibacteria group bacterium]